MPKETPPLEGLRIASPCTVSWDSMAGDDRVRHCGQCRLNVYNLSAMSRGEAEAMVAGREGRLCVRFFRRADGTVLTRDCPVGLAAVRRRLARLGSAVAAVFGMLLAAGCGRAPAPGGGTGEVPTPLMGAPVPPSQVTGRIAVPQPTMGDVAEPPRALQGEMEAPPPR